MVSFNMWRNIERNGNWREYMRSQNIQWKEINSSLSHISNVRIGSNKSSIPYDASTENSLGEK